MLRSAEARANMRAAALRRWATEDRAAHRARLRSANPTYSAVHAWLAVDRGPARERACVDCAEPAHEWSFSPQPDTIVLKSPEGYPYSADLSAYEPRCLRCHRDRDYDDDGRERDAVGRYAGQPVG